MLFIPAQENHIVENQLSIFLRILFRFILRKFNDEIIYLTYIIRIIALK